MTELFELVDGAPRAAPLPVAETLVPMLDDLARAFGCDHGLILVYDDRRRSLRGVSGHNMRPELVDGVDVRIEEQSLIATALASSAPQRIVPLTAPTSGRGTVCRPLVTPGLGSRRAASIG